MSGFDDLFSDLIDGRAPKAVHGKYVERGLEYDFLFFFLNAGTALGSGGSRDGHVCSVSP